MSRRRRESTKRSSKRQMKLFLVLHMWIKVNWETDKVVKKMVGQLVIKVVLDNEEEVVDKVTKMLFCYRGLVYFGPKLLRSEVACEFHQKLCD